MYIRVPNKILF